MKYGLRFFGFLVMLTLTNRADGVDFVWQAGTVAARVKFYKHRPETGQYHYIQNDEHGVRSWNMAKLILPESWTIDSVTVEGLRIYVDADDSGHFTVTPQNLKTLRRELIDADKSLGDARLAEIWKRLAASDKPAAG